YGAFLLVNTSFARANPIEGTARTFSPRAGYDPSAGEARVRFVRLWAGYRRCQLSVVELVHRLTCELPHVPVVVRPHPGEDEGFYHAVFAGLPQVHVV